MDLLKTEDVSSIMIFDIRMSESELQLLSDALDYLLKNLDDEQLNKVFVREDGGTLMENLPETRSFVENRYDEMMAMISNYCREEFLHEKFKKWRDAQDAHSAKKEE